MGLLHDDFGCLQEYEQALDAYRETIHKPLPKDTIHLPAGVLQSSTDAVSEQYKKLKNANVSSKDEVEETIQKAQTYKELEGSLSTWLEDAQGRVEAITNQPVDLTNAEAIKDVTEELAHLDAEIETNKPALGKLKGKH